MSLKVYVYNVNYEAREFDLVGLEIRSLFNINTIEKVFMSPLNIEPSLSAFIKNRIHVIYQTEDFDELLQLIKSAQMKDEDFFVKYIQHSDENLSSKERNSHCKAIGMNMLGYPSFSDPKVIYGLIYFKGLWSFGLLEENNNEWTKHRTKPNSYSSAINSRLAKAITNIATRGNKTVCVIDPCCGVGTIIIEAVFSKYKIIGREINEKIAEDARKNLSFFNYFSEVTTGSIENITETYDVSIVDLPYGILSGFDVRQQNLIIRNARRISERIILVSSEDIKKRIENEKLKIIDCCKIFKTTNREFSRYIWVCEPVTIN